MYSLWRRSTDSNDGKTLHNGFQKEISVEVRVVIGNAEFKVGGCVEGIAFVQIEMEVSPWTRSRRGLQKRREGAGIKFYSRGLTDDSQRYSIRVLTMQCHNSSEVTLLALYCHFDQQYILIANKAAVSSRLDNTTPLLQCFDKWGEPTVEPLQCAFLC